VLPKWPPQDATRLLMGKAISPSKPATDNPVAWTWTNKHGGRAFFTTLGHPEDFAVEAMERLVVNAVHWCLGLPVPDPWKGTFKMDVPYRGMKK
jgi:type 1 glutamine amidotransferase